MIRTRRNRNVSLVSLWFRVLATSLPFLFRARRTISIELITSKTLSQIKTNRLIVARPERHWSPTSAAVTTPKFRENLYFKKGTQLPHSSNSLHFLFFYDKEGYYIYGRNNGAANGTANSERTFLWFEVSAFVAVSKWWEACLLVVIYSAFTFAHSNAWGTTVKHF